MRGRFLIVIGLIGPIASASAQGPYSKAAASESNKLKDCADCPVMVMVPAGSVTMGSLEDEPKRVGEREDRVGVRITKPFAVEAFTVTRGEFAAFDAGRNDHAVLVGLIGLDRPGNYNGNHTYAQGMKGRWRQKTVRVDRCPNTTTRFPPARYF